MYKNTKNERFTIRILRSSSHCLTGMTLSFASFHSFATTTATRFSVAFARDNVLSSVFFSPCGHPLPAD